MSHAHYGCRLNGSEVELPIVATLTSGSGNSFDAAPWDPTTTIGLSLLTPTRIYVQSLLKVVRKGHIKVGFVVVHSTSYLPRTVAASRT